MIPVIAATVVHNRRNGHGYRGSDKFLDNCFIYTLLGFVFFCVIITII